MADTQNMPAPTEDELAFWDVMDEEYQSVMAHFEDQKVTAGADADGRPAGPDDSFWLKEVLKQPLAPDHAYHDPQPLNSLPLMYSGFLADFVSAGRIDMATAVQLQFDFAELSPHLKQQAVRLTQRLLRTKADLGPAASHYYDFAWYLDRAKLDATLRAETLTQFLSLPERDRRDCLTHMDQLSQSMWAANTASITPEVALRVITFAAKAYNFRVETRRDLAAFGLSTVGSASNATGSGPKPQPPFKDGSKASDLAKKLEREKFHQGLRGARSRY